MEEEGPGYRGQRVGGGRREERGGKREEGRERREERGGRREAGCPLDSL